MGEKINQKYERMEKQTVLLPHSDVSIIYLITVLLLRETPIFKALLMSKSPISSGKFHHKIVLSPLALAN